LVAIAYGWRPIASTPSRILGSSKSAPSGPSRKGCVERILSFGTKKCPTLNQNLRCCARNDSLRMPKPLRESTLHIPPTITPQDSLWCVLRRANLVNWFRTITDSSFSCTCALSTAYCTISGAARGWPVGRRRAQTRTNGQLRPASQPSRGLLYRRSSCEKLG
jgi:hypothetical protein